jgi:hypothetical protein
LVHKSLHSLSLEARCSDLGLGEDVVQRIYESKLRHRSEHDRHAHELRAQMRFGKTIFG